jgi:hypothetical protein
MESVMSRESSLVYEAKQLRVYIQHWRWREGRKGLTMKGRIKA